MNKKIKLGVIADDFTGAGDAASFLVKAGYKVIMLTDIVEKFDEVCDCVVMAMKIRSVEPEEAKESVGKVLTFFEKIGVEKYITNTVRHLILRQKGISVSLQII